MLWLPPKVWFHGSQSTSTGGSSARKARHWRIICRFAHSMRWVLITPLGCLRRARGEEELGDRVGADRGVRGIERRRRACVRAGSAKLRDRAAVERALGQHHGACRPAPSPRSPCAYAGPLANTRPGRHGVEDVAQLAVVLRHAANTPARSARRARRPTSRRAPASGARGRCPTGSPPAARPTARRSSSAWPTARARSSICA